MSHQLIEKINTVLRSCNNLDESHDVIKHLIEVNALIDGVFDSAIKDQYIMDQIRALLPKLQTACLHLYVHRNNEIHRIRGNIIASLNSLVFVTQSKLILFVNDEDWCDLDRFYREKSDFFHLEDFFNLALFLENEINYLNKHPLVQYSMGDCKEALVNMLMTPKNYNEVEEFSFIKKLYQAIRNRISIISNYAYSQDINDINEYTVRINNNRAIPTSAFLYDYTVLTREVERDFLCFETFCNIRNAMQDYSEFLTQVKPTFLKWAASMIVTAAGDDFCALFGKFYCKAHVKHFEELLYRRKFPKIHIVYYKLLQTTRGMEEANRIMQTGNDFVVDLLKREVKDEDEQEELDLENPDSMCSDTVVLERMGNLNPTDFNIIILGILDYVTERQWKRNINTFFTRSFSPDTTLEPSLLRVPFSDKLILFTNSQEPIAFNSFYEAFAAWAYHLQRDYEGALYDKETGEKTICTSQLKKMFAL